MSLYQKGDVTRVVETEAEKTKAVWDGFKEVKQGAEAETKSPTAPAGDLADKALALKAEVDDAEVKASLEKRQASLSAKAEASKASKPATNPQS